MKSKVDPEVENVHCVRFYESLQDCEFAYAGDFLCWKKHDSDAINFCNITALKEKAEFSKALDLTKWNKHEVEAKEIDISHYLGKTDRFMVSLNECDVS